MAACFPFTKYLFFISVFIIAFTMIKTSRKMEVLGFNVLLVAVSLFGLFTLNDTMQYLNSFKPSKYPLGGWSMFATTVLLFVSVLLVVLSLNKVHGVFSQTEEPLHLSGFFRENLDKFKDFSIATVFLMFTVSAFSTISDEGFIITVKSLMSFLGDNVTYPFLVGLKFALAIILIALYVHNYNTIGKESTQKVDVILGTMTIVFGGVVLHTFVIPAIRQFFTFDFMSVMIQNAIKVVTLLMCSGGLLWGEYVYNGMFEKETGEYHHIKKTVVPFFVLGSVYTFSLFSEMSVAPHIVQKLLKYGAPAAMLAMSGYLVSISNSFYTVASHDLIA